MNIENMKGDLVLVNINTGETFILHHNVAMYKCGRGKANYVLTCSILASREHCMFLRANGGLNVLDLGSSNGIFINGQRQPSRVMAPVKINDIIGLGSPDLSPEDNPSTLSPGIFKLLRHETESVADLSQATGDTTTKIASENKRRHSRDPLESNVPSKIPKIEVPDIIDISDESSDEIIVPKKIETKTFDKKIVKEPSVSPIKSNISENGGFTKTTELSNSLQENNIEFSFSAGTSTCSAIHGRKKFEDSEKNNNSDLNAASSTCFSTNGRKKSEDGKNLNSPIIARSSNCLNSDGRKKSVDSEKNVNSSNVISTSTDFSGNKRINPDDVEKKSNSSKSPEIDVFLAPNARKKSEDCEKSSNSSKKVETPSIVSNKERKKSVESEISNISKNSAILATNGRKKSADGEEISITSKTPEPSVILSGNERKKSVDSEKNSNSSNDAKISAILSTNERKKLVDGEKNSDSSKITEFSANSSTNRRKRSGDSDKNVNLPNGKKSDIRFSDRKKSTENERNDYEKPSKVRKFDELQTSSSSKETSFPKPTNSKTEPATNDKTISGKKSSNLPKKKLNSSKESLKSSRLKDQSVASSEKTKNSDETETAKKPEETETKNGFFEDDENSDFLAPAFDLDELNLQERMNFNKNDREPEVAKIQSIKNSTVKQSVKYEPELNIIDEDESVYHNLLHLPNENIVPTPIKIKRVKQEPKTRYSEFDVVVLSDDEDGVFPASQLFGDESEDEIDNKVETKEEKIEDTEENIFENSRDDVSDIIVLSDTDDEENPWYDRLLRSQLLNESRLSLNNLVKEEPIEESLPFGVPFGDDLEELFADDMGEKENIGVADDVEEAERIEEEAEEEEDEGLFGAQDLLEKNNEGTTMKDVKEEIFDLCFTSDSNETKKIDKSKRKDKKRSTEKEKSSEKIVPESCQEKQTVEDLEPTEKIEESKKISGNKNRKEKAELESEQIEDKILLPDKRTSRKKRLSDHKISLEKQRLWAEKNANEEKIQNDKKSVSEKRSTDEKIGTSDKRFSEEKKMTEEKRISVEKRSSVEKSSLPKQKSAEKTAQMEKRTSIDKTVVPKQKSVDKSAEKCSEVEKRSSVEKSSLPKQKSAKKSLEIRKTAEKDEKSKPKGKKQEVETRRGSNEAKSSNMSDNSNDRFDFPQEKSKNVENPSENRQIPKENPLVILTKLDNSAKTLQIVDAPFLTNGRHRGVSCKITTIDRSSDNQASPIASTSATNDPIKTPMRKLTTKEKKEEALKARIEQKMQMKEQRHRLQKNKWAANCMLPKKKPALSPFTPKERKDISNDRKEKLKQIANEKKAAEEIQPPTTRRIVRAKAKITTNSRNDFLVKEIEEQAKQNSANVERLASEDEEKNSETPKEKDKSLEIRKENIAGNISPNNEAKSPRGKKGKNTTDNEEKLAQIDNEDNSVKEGEKSPEVETEITISEIDQLLENPIKIQKKTKFLEDSEVPKNVAAKLSKAKAFKKTLASGTAHVFGEQSRRVGKTLMTNTTANLEESSFFVSDPRIRFGKSGKSVLKENREPNENKEAEKKKTKKRVSFNDLNTRIDFFQIEPGNSLKKCVSKDAPLIVKQLPKCNNANSLACCPKLEQFLLHIFKWNPVWLEEQQQFSVAPPVVDETKLSPMLSKYASYDDYYRTTEPLLALELWNGISRDYESKVNQKTCFKYSIVNHSITLATVPSTTVHVTRLMLEVVVSKRDAEKQAHPVYGDLVFFEYISNRKSKEGCQRWKVFAYVTNVRQTVITPFTHFNRDLLTFEKDSHTLLTYTVVTKPLDATDIQTNKVSRLRTISYLRSNIRMIQALQNLPVSPLCNTILHPKVEEYQLPVVANLDNYPLVTKDKLNPRQLEAVARITEAAVQRLPRVCLIQGPPGTGKSRVIVNQVIQILYGNGRYQSNKKLRILVCAPSNAAIDELVLRLLEIRKTFQKGNRFNMVRIGRNESMHPQVKEISVSELAGRDVKKTADTYMSPAFTSDSVEEEKRFLQARMNALQLEISNTTSSKNPLYQRQIVRKLGDIQAKYNLLMNRKPANRLDDREKLRLQRAAENTLLKGADVITCTLTSCYTNQMESIFGGKDSISVCIVDEATQSSEAETLIPLMLGVKTLILVGDTNQLPATVLSQKAKQFGLEQSLFARIQNAFDGQKKDPIILLDTQYRMTIPVAWWPNRFFYAGAIKNDPVKYPFPFHCYKIMDLDSTQNDDKFSNTEEASFVAKVVYTLMTRSKLDHLNAPVKIGVITPYNNQKQLVIQKIRERMANVSEILKKKVIHEVNTVDSFQGQERDVIIMSCVRSNGIGFLSDRQRLCVALTRAKHSLILCGNFRTFKRDQMWNALLTDARERGVYVSIKAKAEIDEIKPHIIR